MPTLSPDNELDYLRRQVLTSRNVRGSRVVDLVLGGLNYQIEHHLFRSMPRPNLRRAQPLVRAYCAELNLPYTETGLGASYAAVLRHLHAVGARCALSACVRRPRCLRPVDRRSQRWSFPSLKVRRHDAIQGAASNRKVRYRGVINNDHWLHHRAAAINLRRLIRPPGLAHNGHRLGTGMSLPMHDDPCLTRRSRPRLVNDAPGKLVVQPRL